VNLNAEVIGANAQVATIRRVQQIGAAIAEAVEPVSAG
jgi:hypothetical protein